jgi:hypothetical protein
MTGLLKILNKRLILAGVFAFWLIAFPSPSMAAWNGWVAKINVSFGDDSNKVIIGAATDAVDGFESRYTGRALLMGYVQAYFYYPEWGLETPYFTRDMRSIYLPQEWTFYVSSRYTSRDMEMHWDTSRVPDTITLVLEDTTTGTTVNMMEASSYTYYNTDSAARTFRVTADGTFELPPGEEPPADSTPPETSITTAVPAFIGTSEVTIEYTGTDDVTAAGSLEYSYSVDNGAWSAWSTGTSAIVSGLSEGQHAFGVKAKDEAGNEDPTPAETSFTVDVTAPALTLNEPNPPNLWPPKGGQKISVIFSGNAIDTGSGLDTVQYTMVDEYGKYASSGTVVPSSSGDFSFGDFSFSLSLEVEKDAGDKDGRQYTVTVTAVDMVGNSVSGTVTVSVRK